MAEELVAGVTLVVAAETTSICWARDSSRPMLLKIFEPVIAGSSAPTRDRSVGELMLVAELSCIAAEYAADVGHVDPAEHMVVVESWRVPPFFSSSERLVGWEVGTVSGLVSVDVAMLGANLRWSEKASWRR